MTWQMPDDERQELSHYASMWGARFKLYRDELIGAGISESLADTITAAYARNFVVADYTAFYKKQQKSTQELYAKFADKLLGKDDDE